MNEALPQKIKILLVDDNAVARQILHDMLESIGYHPIICEGAEEGLKALQSNTPDLILLDINMPDITGLEMLQRLKTDNNYKNFPVIMVSALDSTETIIRCIKLGADDYLLKPFNSAKLKTVLEDSLSPGFSFSELEKIKVVIADDDEDVRKEIQEKLTDFGFSLLNIIIADNGSAALRLIKNKDTDLIICDRDLSLRSGIELLKLVRSDPLLEPCAFIMTASDGNKDKIVEAVLAGVNQYIIKPFDARLLEQKIKQCLKQISRNISQN